MHNLRYALRTLAKSPGFAFTAILTLAVGIGASTAIFTTVDAVLLHPLPYPNASQLVQVTKNMPKFELFKSDASALDFIDYRDLSRSFSHMAAMQTNSVNLTGDCRTGARLRIARLHEPVPDARRAAYRGPRVPS
jgi:putative ABC transport system permease protein